MPADNLRVPIPPSMVLMLGKDGTGHCSDQGFFILDRWLLGKAGNTTLTNPPAGSEWARYSNLG